MGSIEQLMDVGSWDLALLPDTPRSVLKDIDSRTRLWSTFVVTPGHFELGDLSDSDLLGVARYFGVYLGQGQDRLSLDGEGVSWWLGKDGEGGALYASTDITTGSATFSTLMTNQVFIRSNGLVAGTIDSDATSFTIRIEGGDTAREILDTLCRVADGQNYWRVRHDGTSFLLDADALATLWPTATTPTVMLSQEAGRDGGIVGLYAELDLDSLDGREVRTNVQVDWNDGTNNGTATATLPAGYGDLTDGSPVVRSLLDWKPKRNRPPTEKWRKVAAWGASSQTRANKLAAAEINERSEIREEITATLPDLHDPWRYDITPGNTVYIDDLDRNLINTTANQVYFRGEVAHPTTGRVDEMKTPFGEGYGYYLRCYDGVSAFEWIDLTRYVEPEPGAVELKIGQRTRFPVHARHRRLNANQRRRWRRYARRQWRIQQIADYVDAVNN